MKKVIISQISLEVRDEDHGRFGQITVSEKEGNSNSVSGNIPLPELVQLGEQIKDSISAKVIELGYENDLIKEEEVNEEV